ncbi:hypothetical protein LHK_02619 [Laribacter hongkongensis HLHK9]|uniref:Uncharacterized protein n=1 Tax=Laribacter hongkongensis (strain HLHK9) TaxID=557598 RepID=C1DCI1_LARHH|nr:hypothetical protein [Laribacter hongkongensis]ACO75600.1 hypothetical protein LHK_02619 [Laribacter hongkongensis HLHK9]
MNEMTKADGGMPSNQQIRTMALRVMHGALDGKSPQHIEDDLFRFQMVATPAVVLELVDRIEQLEAEVAETGELVTRATKSAEERGFKCGRKTRRSELVHEFTTSRGQRVIGMVTPEGPQVAELVFVTDTIWCGPLSYDIESDEGRLDAGIKALKDMTQDEIDRLDAGLEAYRELFRRLQVNA